MIHAVRRARKLKGIQIANSRIIDVPEDIRQLVDKSKLDALRKRFQAFDSDSSSFIDSTELTPLLQSLGFNPTKERVRDILCAFDTDNTGTLTFGEFVEVWATYCQEAQSEAELIRNSFHFLLQNESQAISFSEFRDTMMSTGDPLTDAEIRRFFTLCDDESDGILRLDEFLKVLYNQPSLDMSLTRISDSNHDHQAIHDLFVNSQRTQRQALASSITTYTPSRPSILESDVESQLKESEGQVSVTADQLRRVGSPKNRNMDSMVVLRSKQLVEYPPEASKHDPTNAAEPCGIVPAMSHAWEGQVQFAAKLAQEDTSREQMRPTVHNDEAAMQLGSKHQAEPGPAVSCEFLDHTCAEVPGLVQRRDCCDASNVVRHRATEMSLANEPKPTKLPHRRHMPLAALPSQVHRKLEAMSAKSIGPPLVRRQAFDSTS